MKILIKEGGQRCVITLMIADGAVLWAGKF